MHHLDAQRRSRVLCVFEGGGARGVAHIGALAAIEATEDFEIVGYAGTSAGSIVAALAAAGWKSDELFDEIDGQVRSRALDLLGERKFRSLADLFGNQWKSIKRARSILYPTENDRWTKFGLILPILLIFIVLISWPFIYHFLQYQHQTVKFSLGAINVFNVSIAAGWIAYILSLIILFKNIYTFVSLFNGVAELEPLTRHLDALLRIKISPEKEDKITFIDLKKSTGMDLKIVAACITSKEMFLFDSTATPNTPVADAVAASCAIPFIFKAIEIDGSQYCDGGIVSNIPAWTFDERRIIEKDCIVVTCELMETDFISPETEKEYLSETESKPKPLLGLNQLKSVVQTSLFGGNSLSTRGLYHHIRIPLNPDIGTLEFESFKKHIQVIPDAFDITVGRIETYRVELESVNTIFEAVHDHLTSLQLSNFNLRVGLVRAVKLANRPAACYQIWAGRGFLDHNDADLLLPIQDSLAGECIQNGCSRYYDLTHREAKEHYLYLEHVLGTHQVLPRDRAWIVCIPIDRESTDGVPYPFLTYGVTLDCDVPLPDEIHEIAQFRQIVDKVSVFDTR